MATETLWLDTSELREGDVILDCGMRILLRGEREEYERSQGTVYGWEGLVTNPEHVKAEGFVPYAWLFPNVWGKGANGGWGIDYDAEPTWRVQGNTLARWSVERKVSE